MSNHVDRLPYAEALEKAKGKTRSVSQLQSYVRCGYAYYLDRIIKVPGRKALWFTQGTAVHEALSEYEQSFRRMDLETVQGHFRRVWHQELEADFLVQPDLTMWMVGGRKKWQTDHDTRHALGLQQVADYVLANDLDNPIRPVEIMEGMAGSELGFELDFKGVRVLGYIDLIMEDTRTGAVFPWDIKTGAHVPQDPYQMATYKHAIERMLDVEVDWGFWWMSKSGGLSAPMDLRPYTFDRVADWYRQIEDGISNGVFLANPGDPCFTCTAKPWCNMIQVEPLPLPDPKFSPSLPVDNHDVPVVEVLEEDFPF